MSWKQTTGDWEVFMAQCLLPFVLELKDNHMTFTEPTTNATGTLKQIAKAEWHIISKIDSHPYTSTPEHTKYEAAIKKEHGVFSRCILRGDISFLVRAALMVDTSVQKREEVFGDELLWMSSLCWQLVSSSNLTLLPQKLTAVTAFCVRATWTSDCTLHHPTHLCVKTRWRILFR